MLWTMYDISNVGYSIIVRIWSRAEAVVCICLQDFLCCCLAGKWRLVFMITFYLLSNWAGVDSKDGVWLKWSALLPGALWPPHFGFHLTINQLPHNTLPKILTDFDRSASLHKTLYKAGGKVTYIFSIVVTLYLEHSNYQQVVEFYEQDGWTL